MGKLTETTQWEDDIYQLETSDPVLGGPDGVSNKPQKQLANRTQWLKQQLETTNSALANHAKSRNHPDASLTAKGFVQLYSGVMSDSEILAATPKAVKIAMDNANARLAKDQNLSDVPDKAKGRSSLEVYSKTESDKNYMAKSQCGADIPDKPLFLQNVGLVDVLFKGDGRFLAGTFVSDAIDRTSIGARAATGCQFMRAHQAPDAPDQVSFWQIITLSEVVSPTTVVDVLAVSGNNVLFGHGTGAGITSWRQVAMLEGGAFTGGISAPNMRGDTLVTVGDGTGGMAKGDVDGAGFNGNNLNIKSWNGIGFQNSEDLAIRVYISTRLGVIAAAENLQAGSAIFNKNGDVYGDIWGGGSGPGWLSAFVASKPARQYITMVGVYQNDKTKPFMLHDDGSGVFLATTDMLSGYVQSIRFGAVEHGNLYRSPGFADQLGYVITGVENGDSNDTPDRIQRRLLQLKVNGQWYTVGA